MVSSASLPRKLPLLGTLQILVADALECRALLSLPFRWLSRTLPKKPSAGGGSDDFDTDGDWFSLSFFCSSSLEDSVSGFGRRLDFGLSSDNRMAKIEKSIQQQCRV